MHLRWAFGVGVFCIGLGFGTRIFTQKPHSIHIAVSGLKLSLPATWRVTRNSANPILVTAVSPMSKINLTITYTPQSENIGPEKWLPSLPEPMLSINPTHPYVLQHMTMANHTTRVTRVETAPGGGKYSVTVSGSSRQEVQQLLQRLQWPTSLTATEAVTHLEVMHDTSKPIWLHHRWGWLFAYGEGTLGFQAIDLFRTTNGGTTWRYAAPTTYQESFPTANNMAGGPILAFATPQHGWVAQVNGNRSGIAIYGTDNGGTSWTFIQSIAIPTPSPDGLSSKTTAIISHIQFALPKLLYTWKTTTVTHHAQFILKGVDSAS